MAVFRVERNTGYTVMSNHHLRNKELSLKAKGLLSQMLSLPEDWDYTLAGLSHINREKIDAIREAVKELEKAGYIVRSRERDEKGRLRGADYVIYEQPQPREPEAATSGGQPPILDLPTLENPTLDNPTLEKPTQEKPTLENPTQLNKDISSKEQSITDLSSTHSFPFHSLNPLPFEQGEAATPPERKRTEAKSNSAVEIYREIIKDNIEYDHLIQNCKIDADRLNEIVDLMLETVCTARKTIRIAGDDYPAELVKSKFLKLNSSHIHIQRGLTTSSTAVFVPFTVQELFQSGEALYYGLNALSNNMILCDRKKLKNPNGLILGTPGSGKSFSAKREITNAFLITSDDIIICDPEAEYYPLVGRLKGQVIKVSQNSTQYINPMDINLNYSEGDTPIALKSDFILSFCELIMGGKNGLEAVEKTLIDRAVISVYRNYLADPKPENMPILGDLYDEIKKQPEKEAQRIAAALELYVSGSLNVFNHRSNIQMDQHRVLCFQLKSLGKALKEIGLLIMQDAVWNRVTANRSKHKTTWFYIDEFHLLLKGQTGSFSVEIWKRFRKWGGIPSGLTQNVKDLLASREIENIFGATR